MKGESITLQVRNLRVARGGVEVLDIPEFHLATGEFVSLIGPNGSGKSTLLLAMMGLLKRVSGGIYFKGRAVETDQQALAFRRRIALVFQEPLLFDASVRENVESGLKIRGLSRQVTKDRVLTYLERFKLSHMAERHARKLSGGEARRVSLARAFAVEPEMIFFDEPFANLDPPTRQALSEDMERVIRDTGISAILVTHDQSEALRWSDRIAVMHGGKVVQTGSPVEVMNSPANEFVANFVGMETVLGGIVNESRGQELTIDVAGRTIHAVGDVATGRAVYCGIRPENITLEAEDPGESSSARNVLPAQIVEIASIGPFLRLGLDCGFPLVAYVTRESFAIMALEEGKRVFACFKATSVHLIPREIGGHDAGE